MDAIINFGLEATLWMQSTFPQLAGFFQFITTLGNESFYLAMMPLVYWCIDKTVGKFLAYLFLFSNTLNTVLKHGFRGPRPFWIDPSLGLDATEGYGVPSNHIQSTAVIYLYLAAMIKRRWVWWAAIALVTVMGLSRIYLGVHFVHDVVAGLLIGLLILVGLAFWKRRLDPAYQKRILGFRLLVMIVIPALFSLIYLGLLFLIGAPNDNIAWAARFPAAELESMEAMTTAVAALFGLGIGITMEGSRIRFHTSGPLWKRFFRYLIGMLIAIGIWAGLDNLFPDDPLWLALPLRFIRYTLLTLWIAYYAPWLFVKINLANQSPEPEINVSL